MTESFNMTLDLTPAQQNEFKGLMHTPLDFWPQELKPIVEEIINKDGFNHETLPKAAVIWVKNNAVIVK